MGRRAPAAIRARTRDEHLLAWAEATEGAVAATRAALHLPDGTRRPWDLVVNVRWEAPLLHLVVQDRPGGANRELDIALPDPGQVPAVVRERVTWSIVAEQHAALEGARGVRILARRTEDEGIRWAVVFDPGLDRSDPGVQAAAEQALARVRASWGV